MRTQDGVLTRLKGTTPPIAFGFEDGRTLVGLIQEADIGIESASLVRWPLSDLLAAPQTSEIYVTLIDYDSDKPSWTMALSRDGNLIAAYKDGTLHLWTSRSSSLLAEFEVDGSGLAGFGHDGQALFFGGWRRVVRVEVGAGALAERACVAVRRPLTMAERSLYFAEPGVVLACRSSLDDVGEDAVDLRRFDFRNGQYLSDVFGELTLRDGRGTTRLDDEVQVRSVVFGDVAGARDVEAVVVVRAAPSSGGDPADTLLLLGGGRLGVRTLGVVQPWDDAKADPRRKSIRRVRIVRRQVSIELENGEGILFEFREGKLERVP